VDRTKSAFTNDAVYTTVDVELIEKLSIASWGRPCSVLVRACLDTQLKENIENILTLLLYVKPVQPRHACFRRSIDETAYST